MCTSKSLASQRNVNEEKREKFTIEKLILKTLYIQKKAAVQPCILCDSLCLGPVPYVLQSFLLHCISCLPFILGLEVESSGGYVHCFLCLCSVLCCLTFLSGKYLFLPVFIFCYITWEKVCSFSFCEERLFCVPLCKFTRRWHSFMYCCLLRHFIWATTLHFTHYLPHTHHHFIYHYRTHVHTPFYGHTILSLSYGAHHISVCSFSTILCSLLPLFGCVIVFLELKRRERERRLLLPSQLLKAFLYAAYLSFIIVLRFHQWQKWISYARTRERRREHWKLFAG